MTASSFLKGKADFYAYHPWKAFDGDPLTAWVAGEEGPGTGESLKTHMLIRYGFGKAVTFDRIDIMPGYYDERWYGKYDRIKKLGIKTGDFTYEVDLDDGMTVKTIVLPRTVEAKDVSFVVLDVYHGTQYDRSCISEVSFFLAGERYEGDAWERERLMDAESHYSELGGTLKKKYPDMDLASPAGKHFNILSMSIARDEYFFEDGRYVCDDGSDGMFYREYGTWRMDPDTNGILVRLTKLARVTGIGEPVQVPLYGGSIFYGEYRYDEQNEDRTLEFEWYWYLYDNFYSELMSSSMNAIQESDQIMMPENWKAQAEKQIKSDMERYKDVSRKLESGYYDTMDE